MARRSHASADKQNKNTRDWYNTHWSMLEGIMRNETPIQDKNISLSDKRLSNYKKVALVGKFPYFVHKTIYKYFRSLSLKEHKVFLNALFYSLIVGDEIISKFVFTACKHRIKREKLKDSVDRFDGFYCMLASDTLVYRHQGTFEGSVLFGQASNPVVKNFNHTMLRILQHGPNSADVNLICSIEGKVIENKTYYHPVLQDDIVMNCFEIHHAVYHNNSSYYYNMSRGCMMKKDISPSKYIHASPYNDFTAQRWMELLSCVIIGISEHDTLHKIVSNGKIDYWIKGYQNSKYASIPYAWRSEDNYNEIIRWIEASCPHLSVANFPDYESFLEMHRGVCSSSPTILLDPDLFGDSKTDPTEQIPSLYNEETV